MAKVVPTERIRNVLVVGHIGTGKSTLVEAMLRTAGHGAHGEGAPTVDDEPEEQERGHSLSLSLASFEFDGCRLNLLDAPGGADVIGDAFPALLAADVALFVVDASRRGCSRNTSSCGALAAERAIPRVVFLNRSMSSAPATRSASMSCGSATASGSPRSTCRSACMRASMG
jgi:elongation factor G